MCEVWMRQSCGRCETFVCCSRVFRPSHCLRCTGVCQIADCSHYKDGRCSLIFSRRVLTVWCNLHVPPGSYVVLFHTRPSIAIRCQSWMYYDLNQSPTALEPGGISRMNGAHLNEMYGTRGSIEPTRPLRCHHRCSMGLGGGRGEGGEELGDQHRVQLSSLGHGLPNILIRVCSGFFLFLLWLVSNAKRPILSHLRAI